MLAPAPAAAGAVRAHVSGAGGFERRAHAAERRADALGQFAGEELGGEHRLLRERSHDRLPALDGESFEGDGGRVRRLGSTLHQPAHRPPLDVDLPRLAPLGVVQPLGQRVLARHRLHERAPRPPEPAAGVGRVAEDGAHAAAHPSRMHRGHARPRPAAPMEVRHGQLLSPSAAFSMSTVNGPLSIILSCFIRPLPRPRRAA